MMARNLNEEDKRLLRSARELMRIRKSKASSVASCLRTKKGTTFRGVCIDLSTGMCAEYGAVASMVTEGQMEIDTIVAVTFNAKSKLYPILPPCGRCRQLLVEFGNPWVIVRENQKFRLSDLYPVPWRGGFGS